MNKTRLIVAVCLIALIVIGFSVDLGQYLTLEFFRTQQERVQEFVTGQPLVAAATFFVVYVAVAALNIPAAGVLTLIAGALFGIVRGTIIVSFASSIGATLALLLSRFHLSRTDVWTSPL